MGRRQSGRESSATPTAPTWPRWRRLRAGRVTGGRWHYRLVRLRAWGVSVAELSVVVGVGESRLRVVCRDYGPNPEEPDVFRTVNLLGFFFAARLSRNQFCSASFGVMYPSAEWSLF